MMIAPAPSINNAELLINNLKDTVAVTGGAPIRSSTRPCAKRAQPEQPVCLLKESRRVIFPSHYMRPAQVHAVSETSPSIPDVIPFAPPSSINKKPHHVPESSSTTTLKGRYEGFLQSKLDETPFSAFLTFFKQNTAPVERQVPKRVPEEDHLLPNRVVTPDIEFAESVDMLPVIREEAITPLSEPELRAETEKSRSPPTTLVKPLSSILRSKRYRAAKDVTKISSVDSDIPSLDSSVGSESQTSNVDEGGGVTSPLRCKQNSADLDGDQFRPVQHTRSIGTGKYISFDARVWVCEFERAPGERESTWYTNKDLEGFKQEAVQRILQYTEQQSKLVPIGTGIGRSMRIQGPPPCSNRALFSHVALQALDGELDTTTSIDPGFRQAVLENEIRSILLVDPHDIYLKLFTKSLKNALPHVVVTACTSSEEAMEHLEPATTAGSGSTAPVKKRRFDIIIIEERLKIFHRQHRNGGATQRNGGEYSSAKECHASGSALLRSLSSVGDSHSKSVFVGVSARLAEDGARLKESGADFCWAKPPPPMNPVLMDDLLKALLLKRGRSTVVKELFG
jgi:CheY-like chemotaxis protein